MNRKVLFLFRLAILSSMVCLTSIVCSAAESVYSGSNNRGNLSEGAVGPLNLGDRAQYGSMQLRGNQEFTYDDNLYLTQTGRTNDWASITSPGIVYRLGNREHNAFELGYDVNVIRYFDISNEDGEEHMPYAKFLFTLGSTKLTIEDSLMFVQGGSFRGAANETTSRVSKTTNDLLIGSETQLDDKLALGFHIHNYEYDPQGGQFERNQTDGGAAIFYKAFAKVDLYLEADGGHVSVLRAGSEDFAQGKVGFRGQLTPKLVGKFDVGGEHRTINANGQSTDQDSPILGGSLTQTFTDDLVGSVRASRDVSTSISSVGQTITTSTVGFNLQYQFGPAAKAGKRKFALGLDYSYANAEFRIGTPAQNIDIHTVAPSIEYRIQDYWKVYLVYRYQDLDSNILGSDYQNNRVSLGTAVLF